jgi:hypothetical protein
MTIQPSVLAPAGLGITGRTTVGRHRAELWWVSAAWIARLGGEQDEAHFLDRPGDAEESRGPSSSQGPAAAAHSCWTAPPGLWAGRRLSAIRSGKTGTSR